MPGTLFILALAHWMCLNWSDLSSFATKWLKMGWSHHNVIVPQLKSVFNSSIILNSNFISTTLYSMKRQIRGYHHPAIFCFNFLRKTGPTRPNPPSTLYYISHRVIHHSANRSQRFLKGHQKEKKRLKGVIGLKDLWYPSPGS